MTLRHFARGRRRPAPTPGRAAAGRSPAGGSAVRVGPRTPGQAPDERPAVGISRLTGGRSGQVILALGHSPSPGRRQSHSSIVAECGARKACARSRRATHLAVRTAVTRVLPEGPTLIRTSSMRLPPGSGREPEPASRGSLARWPWFAGDPIASMPTETDCGDRSVHVGRMGMYRSTGASCLDALDQHRHGGKRALVIRGVPVPGNGANLPANISSIGLCEPGGHVLAVTARRTGTKIVSGTGARAATLAGRTVTLTPPLAVGQRCASSVVDRG